jgi:hypothetical protein
MRCIGKVQVARSPVGASLTLMRWRTLYDILAADNGTSTDAS